MHRLRASPEDVWQELGRAGIPAAPVSWSELVATVASEFRAPLLESPLSDAGQIYIQSLSSIAVGQLVDARPGDTVLDLAAAPGGKALVIADAMRNTGILSLVEPIRPRYYKLRHQLQRYGVSNARAYLTDGRSVGRKTPDRFDKILVDAPCSGEARFRFRSPNSWGYWSPRKLREQARKQKGLLRSGLAALKPGGTLVYATCSFAPEENELVIQGILDRDDFDIELLDCPLPAPSVLPGLSCWDGKSLDERLQQCRRIVPDQTWDGFFVARIRKLG